MLLYALESQISSKIPDEGICDWETSYTTWAIPTTATMQIIVTYQRIIFIATS